MSADGFDPAPLEARLGHRFAARERLREALTHPSLNDPDNPFPHGYERLEFLGDRVLGLVVAEALMARHPDLPEGDLARHHTALVRREALVEVARALALKDHLIVDAGARDAAGEPPPSLLANATEALIGALFLDGGYAVARAFVLAHWEPLMARPGPGRDPKTALQEWAQGHGLGLPSYHQSARQGPDHAPRFTIDVEVEGLARASGEGTTKREAEKAAAQALLAILDQEGRR
ncbi:ribonuclease III [Roseospirillum parvum]|uniref:Ribonuclease 3 n=1 Tax=Roseospirillum parvum TaxID=83401 RepID=A0A1G7YLM7_9PROT|nr:ribonuclease III [Roseospirillum parvum]SDG97246.1 ribonuclease-3 [Roseospirillum parvum]